MVQAHSEKSKQDLTAYEQFKDPQMVTVTTLMPNRKEIGKAFKKDAKVLAPRTHAAIAHGCEGACTSRIKAGRSVQFRWSALESRVPSWSTASSCSALTCRAVADD